MFQSKRHNWILLIAILLFFWGQRVWVLDAFPIFLDEATHLYYGNQISQTGLLAYSPEGRQLTYWYFLFFQPLASGNPIWVARVATMLVVMVAFSAFIASGRILAGQRGMLFAAVIYTLSTYHFFFDRLAMADTLSSAMIIVCVYFALRLRYRVAYRDAILLGLSLFIAILFKLSSIPFYGIPVAAVVAIQHPKLTIRKRGMWGATAIGIAIGLVLLWWGLLSVRGYSFLSLFGAHNSSGSSLTNWVQNATFAWLWLGDYYSIFVIVLIIAATIYCVMRGQWFLPLVAYAPLAAILVNSRQTPRYWMGSASVLLLILAIGFAWLSERYRLWANLLISGLIVIWAGVAWLPFVSAAYLNPLDLPLPEREFNEYLVADAAGTGLQAITDILDTQDAPRIIGMLSNCWGLRYTASHLTIECPRLNPNGEDIPVLQAIADNADRGTIIILEDSNYAPETIAGEILAVVERPKQRANLTVYRIID